MTTEEWAQIKYFHADEFSSPDAPGSGEKMDFTFVKMLDRLRENCGFPLAVLSGYRTVEHNKEVGGVDSSAHEDGVAADIRAMDSRTRYVIIAEALKLGIHRVGLGFSFVHLDISEEHPQEVAWMYPQSVVRARQT